jgi:hypothetical protein
MGMAALRRRRTLAATLLTALLAALTAAPVAQAINITIELLNEGENPSFDQNGTQLAAIFNAAATFWEDALPEPGTFNVKLAWRLYGANDQAAATWHPNPGDNKITVRTNPTSPWFFDTTPLEHSEFNMSAVLFRDLSVSQKDAFFDGDTSPSLMEVGFQGQAVGGQAASRFDLLTIAVHELGHEMGINSFSEAWESDPAWTNGAIVEIKKSGFASGHLAANPALMFPSGTVGQRVLPGAVDIMAAADDQDVFSIDLPRKDFDRPGGGTWNIASNWLGGRVPDSQDEVSIRSPATGTPAMVTLSGLGVVGRARELTISEGAHLDIVGTTLDVEGSLRVSGPDCALIVDGGGTAQANTIVIENTTLDIAGGTVMAATFRNELSLLKGSTPGTKSVQISGSLSNDGGIIAENGARLELSSTASTPWDLDGSEGINTGGAVTALTGDVIVLSGSQTDAFGGVMLIGAGRRFESATAWTTDGRIDLRGSDNGSIPARISGSAVTFQNADVTADGITSIEAQATFRAYTDVALVDSDTVLYVGSPLAGGSFITLEEADFEGPGRLVFQEDVVVETGTTSRIDVGQLDWDGTSGGSHTRVETSATLTIAGGAIDGIHRGGIELQQYATIVMHTAPWTMEGRLEFTGGHGNILGTAQMTLNGALVAKGLGNYIGPSVVVGSGASVDVGYGGGDEIDFLGATTYTGGSYFGSGRIAQSGAGTVSADTTVGALSSFLALGGENYKPLHVQEYDWDGQAEASAQFTIEPGASFIINAVQIESQRDDGYDGHLSINGGTLVINTADRTPLGPKGGAQPKEVIPARLTPLAWRMEGTMNLFASPGKKAIVTTAADSAMLIYGTVHATHGDSSIHLAELVEGGSINVSAGADLTATDLTANGRIDINGTLRLQGATLTPASAVHIDGALNLTGMTFIEGGSYTGDGRISQDGTAAVTGSTTLEVGIDFLGGSATTIVDDEELRLARPSVVFAETTIAGPGALRNLAELHLADGVRLGVPLVNDGTLQLGTSRDDAVVATTSIQSLAQASKGELVIDIVPAFGDSDRLQVSDHALLGGVLSVEGISELAQPDPDDVFTILAADSISGKFANALDGQRLAASFGSFLVHYLSDSVVLSDFAVGLPGDYNSDGSVDAADYVVWRRALGDQDTYSTWRANFRAVADGGGSATTVPEPSALVLVVLLVGVATVVRHDRRNLDTSGGWCAAEFEKRYDVSSNCRRRYLAS